MGKKKVKVEGGEATPKGSVTVVWEGGERTYTGPDAQKNAESFVSKRPEGVRKIV